MLKERGLYMEYDASALPLSERSSMPDGASHNALITVLDALDAQVLILDRESCIRFFNKSYLTAYAEPFLQAGVSLSRILNLKLSDRNSPAGMRVLRTMEDGKLLQREYFYESDTQYSGLADLVPIKTDTFQGIAVIQQEDKKIGEL